MSLSKDFFIIVHIDLQLSDGFQSFFLARQLPFFVVHGDSILKDCDFPQEGVEAVHGIKTVPFLQGLEGCDVVDFALELAQHNTFPVMAQFRSALDHFDKDPFIPASCIAGFDGA